MFMPLSKIFSVPQWVQNLLKFRNKLLGGFGLKTRKASLYQDFYPLGSKAVFLWLLPVTKTKL